MGHPPTTHPNHHVDELDVAWGIDTSSEDIGLAFCVANRTFSGRSGGTSLCGLIVVPYNALLESFDSLQAQDSAVVRGVDVTTWYMMS